MTLTPILILKTGLPIFSSWHTPMEKRNTHAARDHLHVGEFPIVNISSGNNNRFRLGHNVLHVDDLSDFITLTHSIVTQSGK